MRNYFLFKTKRETGNWAKALREKGNKAEVEKLEHPVSLKQGSEVSEMRYSVCWRF